MNLHPRYFRVKEIQARVALDFVKATQELTTGERVQLLSDLLTQEAKYAIRDERHPVESGRKGDGI